MAQGEGEREEIGIFLIKMQFYKFFYLMLQELNIIFLLLDLREGCLLTGWQRQRQAQERKIFSSSD